MAQVIFHKVASPAGHLLLLCALLRLTSEEISMLATSSWGVSGEISILIPLLQKRFFLKFKTQSCLANLSLVAATSYTILVYPFLWFV